MKARGSTSWTTTSTWPTASVRLFRRQGLEARAFASPAELTSAYLSVGAVCIVSDVMLAGAHGFDAAGGFRALDPACAIVFMTAWPSTVDAVDAVRRHGGVDYLEKPLDVGRLLASVQDGLEWRARRRRAENRLQGLSGREREVLNLLAAGMSTKAIAAELNLSPKTVEDHRAGIRAKTGASNLQQLLSLVR